jgi:hypothetical protein
MMGAQSRGAPNAKAKRQLGWTLRYPSWRQGFVAAYASTAPTDGRKASPGRPNKSLAELSAFRSARWHLPHASAIRAN